MGTWDSGSFDNDMAVDAFREAQESPEELASWLQVCADAPADADLDVDDGQAAVAIAEAVALAFGQGDLAAAPPWVRARVRAIGPNEELRQLALRALPRVRDRAHSELASLWAHDPEHDAKLADLITRLAAAGA